MKKKLMDEGSSVGPTNDVGRSYTSPPLSRQVEEMKDKAPTHEIDGESCLNKSVRTTVTLNSARRHPFTNVLIEAPLPDKWKDFNRDRYDVTTDPDEHMDAYTTHKSPYTSDDAVLCRVFPMSLKEGALSWFTKLQLNSIDSFATLLSKFESQFSINRPHHLTSIALVDICHEKGE